MAHIIIHHDGVFNIHSTIADSPLHVSGLTEAQLRQHYEENYAASLNLYPEHGIMSFDSRVKRAKECGTSCLISGTLEHAIRCNRAGVKESNLNIEDFIKQYLTFKG